MRGASALADLLNDAEGHEALLFLVWEPVLDLDFAPPSELVWSAVASPRTWQYWDAKQQLSTLMRNGHRFDSECISGGDAPNVVWDSVFFFSPSDEWSEQPPRATYCGRTILRALAGLRDKLAHP